MSLDRESSATNSMSKDHQFRFSIPELPEGEALTVTEIEQRLLKSLNASGGKCLQSLWSLANLYKQSEQLDQASEYIQRFIKLADNPEDVGSAYLALGQLEEKRRDYSAAVRRYREALSLEPCSTDTWYFIHNNLGYSLNQIGEHKSAIPYLQTALSIDPDRPNAYKNLGLAHEALGVFEKAAEFFVTATQVDATDGRSLEHLLSLVAAHPELLVDIADLADRMEACRKAAEVARQHQPDFNKHWDDQRAAQQRKWWRLWKR
jgi:tetratricopeptide (TPR) repeat protein